MLKQSALIQILKWITIALAILLPHSLNWGDLSVKWPPLADKIIPYIQQPVQEEYIKAPVD